MASKIHLLSNQTINFIAAGEVVENAASVVKELIENALDAGATQVRITTRAAGRQLICVSDNGCGMSAEDTRLSVERHATSKIRETDDLAAVVSLGFRGEALAAIASVSTLAITSSEGREAYRVVIEGGQLLERGLAARPRGTTVEVRNLFFNAPVRREFQCALSQDKRHLIQVVTQAALAHPEVGFWLTMDEDAILTSPSAEQLLDRVHSLIGGLPRESWLEVEEAQGGSSLKGFVGSPPHARPSRSAQILCINGRPVVSRLISDAVREGFATRLATEHHPLFVLHLSLPAAQIDVNVHPQKKEIRFRDEAGAQEFVIQAVSRRLSRPQRNQSLSAPSSAPASPIFSQLQLREPEPPAPAAAAPEQGRLPLSLSIRVVAVHQTVALVEEETLCEELRLALGPCKDPCWVLIDLVACSTSLLFSHLVQSAAPSTQPLLIPLTLPVTVQESRVLTEYRDALADMGFLVRPFGEGVILVEGLPEGVPAGDLALLIRELFSALNRQQRSAPAGHSLQARTALILSKQIAARSGSYTIETAGRLIAEWAAKKLPFYAPSGQAVLSRLSLSEIQGRFGRARTQETTSGPR
jgi:DNA mismatch repair protein MutL